MIRSFGYYAANTGMVIVPSLTGLTSQQIIAALSSSGLVAGIETTTTTGATSTNDNLFATSTPLPGSLVDYGTIVNFVTYDYVVSPTPTPSPSPSPCPAPRTITWGYCNGSTEVTGTIDYDACTKTFEQALEEVWPVNSRPAGFTATNGIWTPLNCGGGSGPCLNTYSFTYYDGGCNYAIYNCQGANVGSTRVTSCESPGVDSSGATIPGCSQNCAPAPSPSPSPSPEPAPTFGFFR